MNEIKPADPVASNYPLPLSPRRARFEARRARRQRVQLPKGHPYHRVPSWVPFPLAVMIARMLFRPHTRLSPSSSKTPTPTAVDPPGPTRTAAPEAAAISIEGPKTPSPVKVEPTEAVQAPDAFLAGAMSTAALLDGADQPPPGIPFAEAGADIELRLGMRDLRVLADEFGDGSLQAAALRCERLDIAFIARVLQLGGRRGGQRFPIDIDQLDAIPVVKMAEAVMAALELAALGRQTRPGGGGNGARPAIGIAPTTPRLAGSKRRSDISGPSAIRLGVARFASTFVPLPLEPSAQTAAA